MNDFAEDPSRQDLSLLALLAFVGGNKVLIGAFIAVFTLGAVALAFVLTPKYRAEVVIEPADSSSGLGDLGQLGGLASLAGINIGGGMSKKSDAALEYLRSRTFTAGFIQRHGLMPLLVAKKWDAARNQWRDPGDAPTIAAGSQSSSRKGQADFRGPAHRHRDRGHRLEGPGGGRGVGQLADRRGRQGPARKGPSPSRAAASNI